MINEKIMMELELLNTSDLYSVTLFVADKNYTNMIVSYSTEDEILTLHNAFVKFDFEVKCFEKLTNDRDTLYIIEGLYGKIELIRQRTDLVEILKDTDVINFFGDTDKTFVMDGIDVTKIDNAVIVKGMSINEDDEEFEDTFEIDLNNVLLLKEEGYNFEGTQVNIYFKDNTTVVLSIDYKDIQVKDIHYEV